MAVVELYQRKERIAVSVDMLSTGYNCGDALNIRLTPSQYYAIVRKVCRKQGEDSMR